MYISPFKSLRVRLIWLIFIAIVPALLYIFVDASIQKSHREAEMRDDVMHVADLAASNIEHIIEGSRQTITSYAHLPAVLNNDPAACSNYVNQIKVHLPMYSVVAAFKPNGDVFCSSIPFGKKTNVSDRLFFKNAVRTGDFVIGDYPVLQSTELPAVTLTLPVYDEAKNLRAVASFGINLQWIESRLDKINLPIGAALTLSDRNNNILYYRNHDDNKLTANRLKNTRVTATAISDFRGVLTSVSKVDGIKRIWAYTTIPGTNDALTIRYGVPYAMAFKDVGKLLVVNLMVLMIIALTAIIIAWYGGNYFVMNRLEKLRKATNDVANGDLSVRVSMDTTKDEISHLINSFNMMATSLEKHSKELERSEIERQSAIQRLELATIIAKLGVWDWDLENHKIIVNERMRELYGFYDNTIFTSIDDWSKFVHDDDRERAVKEFRAAILGEKEWDCNFRVKQPSGAIKHLRANGMIIRNKDGVPVRMLGVNFDLTDQINLEEQFRHAQKMEAIGTLAGGVAHDFNNVLSAIVGYSHLTLMEMKPNDQNKQSIEFILEAANRGAVLTSRLLAFSRKQTVNLTKIMLNDVIIQFDKFLHRLIREDIVLTSTLVKNDIAIMADRGQLEQILMNLITNARDAMQEGGRISIETSQATIDNSFIRANGFGKEGDYALMTVTDTGSGIPPEIQSRIFDPFFTTKEEGKGTGLGLSTVYGIVKKHNGFINIASQPGQGTTIKIYLPAAAPDAVSQEQKDTEEDTIRGGTEVILVAEDDITLRILMSNSLRQYGYAVLEAKNGKDALEKFTQNKDDVRLVVMDVIMPEMNGKIAWKHMRTASPRLKAIFMSGYAEDILTNMNVSRENTAFMQKPASPMALAKLVRELLDQQRDAEFDELLKEQSQTAIKQRE